MVIGLLKSSFTSTEDLKQISWHEMTSQFENLMVWTLKKSVWLSLVT
jgi:hypothetical protein